MSIIEIIGIGIGLAMDAFAVSICKGLFSKKCIKISLYFAFFQFIMPILGYLIGSYFAYKISLYGNWIVFGLLIYIGLRMIIEKDEEENEDTSFKTMLSLSVATSIDAMGVGIAFSFLKVNIFFSSIIIGIVTFIICLIGVKIGNYFGDKYKKIAKILGGLILIFIGIKILLEHLVN